MKRKTQKGPKQIQVPTASFPDPREHSLKIVQIVTRAPLGEMSGANSSERESLEKLSKAMIVIANQSWRMATTIHDSNSKEPKVELTPQEIKKLSKAIEMVQETMVSLGIEIIDKQGMAFNAGMPEQVVTEEQQEGIIGERILRTIRPTILWNKRMVQPGQIDIAVPKSNSK